MDYRCSSTHQNRKDQKRDVELMPCAARSMKMKISSMLHILTVWTSLHLSVAQPSVPFINYTTVTWGPICGEHTNGSTFQVHQKEVVESLVMNVSTSGFNISIEGQNSNSTVYGLAQCRGDLNSSDCKQCALKTKAMLVDNCQNNICGFVLLDGCFLRYDNHSFYNYTDQVNQTKAVCNEQSTSQQFPSVVNDVLSNITQKALQSDQLFATTVDKAESSPSKLIYSLAQCWRDLSKTSCKWCLAAGESIVTGTSNQSVSVGCNAGANGGQFHTMGCDLRYEIYSFFDTPMAETPQSLGEVPALSPADSPLSPGESEGKKSKVLGITLGVAAAAGVLIATIGLFGLRSKRWGRISGSGGEGGQISLSPCIANRELLFTYETLKEATSNFKAENKLGEGGFGSVFKGVLSDGIEVAVKRLKIGSNQGDHEFLSEANLISCVQHKNIVKMLGCCVEGSERLLVYEYLHNSSLDKIIFDITKRQLLNWRERYEIIVGTARGLAYLHEETGSQIIHRDIKASNILLDNKYRPKISDFGLAKLFGEDQTHVSTRIAGTFGYIAPEYALRGQLTQKADVFSFGVLLLEIISGRKNQSFPQHMEFLIEVTWRLYSAERALEVMDPTMEGNYSWEEEIRLIKIGLLCTQGAAPLRPSMSRVVSMLTSEQEHIPAPTMPAYFDQIEHVALSEDPGSTSNQALEAATNYSTIPSSSILEPR